jgi:tetratricopeptide (TPR) repeat protein
MRSISSLPATALAVIVSLALAGSACGRVNQLKGAKAYKAANAAYQTQDYKKASDLYLEAITDDPDFPDFAPAYFFLGNCYDNLWKPSKKGDPTNDMLLQDAVKNYQTAADKLMASDKPEYKKLGKLSLQYLVAAYGPEKLDDAGKAEPILQHMIQLEPGDPANYFMLARLYDDAGVPDEAERIYIAAKDAKPNDPAVYMSLAAHYNQLGQFDKTIEALEQRATKEPDNPEAYQTIASYYWDKANKDSRLTDGQKRDYVLKGIASVDRALQIKPDYAEGMVYKGLLLRLQANLEKDAAKQQALLKEAVSLHDKAEEIRKKRASGA